MKKIGIALLLASSLAYAQLAPKKNIGGGGGVVFPKSKTRVVVKYLSVVKNKAYDGDDEVNDPKDREQKLQKTLLAIKSGIGHNMELIAKIPYISKKLTQTAQNKTFDMDNSGVGDVSLIIRYALSNQKKGDFAFSSIGLGIKFPTGTTDESFSTPMGTKKPSQTQTLQLGSGSYDYIAQIGWTKLIKNSRIDASINYIFTTEGDNDYEFGDKLKWNIGYLQSLNNMFVVQLELDGIHLQKNKYKGNDVDSSGGNFIYITPGFQIQFNKKFDLSVGYSKMIKRDNNYDSSSKTGGLSEDYRAIVRLGYIL